LAQNGKSANWSKGIGGSGLEIVKVGINLRFSSRIETAKVSGSFISRRSFDAVPLAAGQVAFAPLSELNAENVAVFVGKQTHGSDQLGSGAIPFIKEKGSFTLVFGHSQMTSRSSPASAASTVSAR